MPYSRIKLPKLIKQEHQLENLKDVNLKGNCMLLDTQSPSGLLSQVVEIIGILPNRVCGRARSNKLMDPQLTNYFPSETEGAESEDGDIDRAIYCWGTEMPKWFNHQSVDNSIFFFVGHKFPKLAVCVVPRREFVSGFVHISINVSFAFDATLIAMLAVEVIGRPQISFCLGCELSLQILCGTFKKESFDEPSTLRMRHCFLQVGGNDKPFKYSKNCLLACLSSGIGGAIQLGVLDENELSNCINRGLEHWFQSYFQGCSCQRYIYNDCFPKCEIPERFCHQSGSLLRIQLIPNLYTNSDWIRIALFATFTVHKHPTLILDNLATEISHGFSCSLRSDMGSWTVSNKHYITESEHNKFICHDNDNVEGETSGTGGSNGTLRGLQDKIKQQSHDDDDDDDKDEGETSGSGRSNGTLRVPHYQEKVCATCYQKFIDAGGPTHYCHRREHSEEFHLHYPYDRCFPPTKIPELFSHYASGSSMTIQLPSNLHNDSNWLGFALCAAFSVQEYPTEFLDNLETEIPHHLSCLFDMDIGGLKPLHVYSTFKEELKWLHLHGFIWLSYIPYWWLSDKINQCNHIEVSIASDWPGWIVQKCGLRPVYLQDEQEF
nr:hypothetical protein CFP56_49837 [Quercus suber]